MDAPRSPRLGLLQAAVSLAALAGIAWWATRQRAPHISLDATSLLRLTAALVVYAAAMSLRAERWHRILRHERLDKGRGESFRLTFVGYMGNNTLPARAGDLMRVVYLGGPRRRVLGTVIAERLLDVCALAAIFALVVALRGLSFGPLPYVAGAGAAGLVALTVVWRFTPRVREFARPAGAATRSLLSLHGVLLLFVSLALWSLEATVYGITASAVGIHLGVGGALYVMALTNLSAVVPAAPGYVGTYDAAVLLALRSLHEPALGYLLVLRFVLFVPVTIVGFAIFLARYGRSRR